MVDRLNLKLSDGNRVRSNRSSDNWKNNKINLFNANNKIKFINSIFVYENVDIYNMERLRIKIIYVLLDEFYNLVKVM